MLHNLNVPTNAKRVTNVAVQHYRNMEEDLQTISNLGGVTAAFQFELVDTQSVGTMLLLRVGIAVCRDDENFSRKHGTCLAKLRLQGHVEMDEKGDLTVPHNPDMTITRIIHTDLTSSADEEIVVHYHKDGAMYFDAWMYEMVEQLVQSYLEATLFADIEQREGTADVADEPDEDDDDSDDEDDDEPTVLVIDGRRATQDDEDEDDDDEEDEDPPAAAKKSKRVH